MCIQKPDNVASSSLPMICQWPHGTLRTWAHDVRLYIAGANEPKSAQKVKQGA